MSAEHGSARWLVVAALGTAQTLAWASSYYLPAILAGPMAASLGVPQAWVFGAFLGCAAALGGLGAVAGGAIDRLGGRLVLTASSLVLRRGGWCCWRSHHRSQCCA